MSEIYVTSLECVIKTVFGFFMEYKFSLLIRAKELFMRLNYMNWYSCWGIELEHIYALKQLF